MNQPLISIIIPYYHGERFITETLDSLFAQNYRNLEIIIVNDGSPAETLICLEPYLDRITIIHQENKGQAGARNTGLRRASGDFFAMIDQDDLWPPGRIAMTLPYLQNDQYDFLRGMTKCFEILPDGTRTSSDPGFFLVLVGAALYTRKVIDIAGFFDETMREGDDFDWNVRLDESSLRCKQLAEITLLYRKHGNNFSLTAEDYVRKGLLRSIKNKLDRAKNNL